MKKLGAERLNNVLRDLQLVADRAGFEHRLSESMLYIALRRVSCTFL